MLLWSTVPSVASFSPYFRVICVPAGPDTDSLAQPAVFCLKSKTYTPLRGEVIWVACSYRTTFWGGNIWALKTPPGDLTTKALFQLASSRYEEVDHPGFSRRASYVSPLRMPSKTMGPAATFQFSSVTTVCVVPSW